jgi:hypothetical protein
MAKEKVGLSRGRWRLYTAAAIFVIALIYLGSRSQAYNFDGTVFALYLRYSAAGGDIIRVVHPHHLIYQPLAHLFYRLLEAFSYEPVTIFALELLSTLFGISGLILFYLLLKELGHPPMIRFFTFLALAFSFGYFLFSLEAEVYTLSSFFLIATFLSIILTLRKKSNALSFNAGLFFGIGVLAHITNFLFLPACLFLLKKNKRRLSYFLGASALIPLISYGIVLILKGFPNLDAGLSWFLGAAADRAPGTSLIRWSASPVNFLISLKSLGKALVTADCYPADPLSLPFIITRYIVLTIAGLLFFLSLKQIRKKDEAITASLIWFLSYFIFFSFWDVGGIEFFVAMLPPFFLILASGGSELIRTFGSRKAIGVYFLFIALILIINLTCGIRPRSEAENNLNYQKALFIKEHTEKEDVVMIIGYPGEGFNYGKIYIPYFAERETIILDWLTGQGKEGLHPVERAIREKLTAGKRVVLLSEVTLDCPARRAFLKSHRMDYSLFDDFIHRFILLPQAVFSPDFKLIRLLPPPNYLGDIK